MRLRGLLPAPRQPPGLLAEEVEPEQEPQHLVIAPEHQAPARAHEGQLGDQVVGRVADGRQQQLEQALPVGAEPRLPREVLADGLDDPKIPRVAPQRLVGDQLADRRIGRVLVSQPDQDQLLQHHLATRCPGVAALQVLGGRLMAAEDRGRGKGLDEAKQRPIERRAQLPGEVCAQGAEGPRRRLRAERRDHRVEHLVQQAHGVDLGGLQHLPLGEPPPRIEHLREELAALDGREDHVAACGEEGVVGADLLARRLLHVEVPARAVERAPGEAGKQESEAVGHRASHPCSNAVRRDVSPSDDPGRRPIAPP